MSNTNKTRKGQLSNCPFCGKPIDNMRDFNDDLSWKEYKISGLCQTCQDGFFGKDEDKEDEQ